MRRVSYHRTLAQRTKAPAQVDASGDALMAAMSVPAPGVSSESPAKGLAEVVADLSRQLLAFQSGDLDAIASGWKWAHASLDELRRMASSERQAG